LDNFINFLKKIQADKRFKDFDEAAIKQAIVLKILSLLEWDPFNIDELQSEYMLKEDKIDFALKHKESLKVFVSVKKDSKNFKKNIEMLLGLSAQSDVKIAVFTNGSSWWFFLPLIEGSIDDKRFCTIDIQQQKLEDIDKKFSDFLSKKNIISNKAFELAEHICNEKKQRVLINEYLPKAWQKILDEPDRWLVDVISEVTESLSGYKPDREKVKEFIISEVKIIPKRSDDLESSSEKKISGKVEKDYKRKSVKSFKFKDEEHNVKSWPEIPWKISDIISKKHKDIFEDVLLTITLKGRNFFSKNEFEFLMPKKIPNTDIYINFDLSEMTALSLSKKILSNFGYKEGDLVINAT
jgi:hypothetical protein